MFKLGQTFGTLSDWQPLFQGNLPGLLLFGFSLFSLVFREILEILVILVPVLV